jgi:subtilisin family serine protease
MLVGLFCLFVWPSLALAADRVPNDSFYGEQWHLGHIRAPEAWHRSLGFEGIAVAVIDSGVDIDHPDLQANIWRNLDERPGNGIDDDGNGYVDDVWGWDFVGRDSDPRPDIGDGSSPWAVSHGTVNAGLVAASGDNGIGVTGVSWQTKVMAIRALDSDGSGDPFQVVRAIEYAVNNGADIINLSFTGSTRNELLAIALRNAYDAGVLVVAAAGNANESGIAPDLDRNPLYPACLDDGADENFILAVTSVDSQDQRADFAAYGAGCVDLAAPGTRIVSTQFYRPGSDNFDAPYGGYYNGTSVSAAQVSGVASLLLAVNPRLTPKQIMNYLQRSAVDIYDKNPAYFGRLGRGRVDAATAVDLVLAELAVRQNPEPVPTVPASEGTGWQVAAAPGAGYAPEVRLFTPDGLFAGSFLAYPRAFQGGVNLTVGDFDGTGNHSLVTGAGPGGGPHVRVFNRAGQPIGGFFAYDEQFRGGVSVAAGDLDGDGRDEIITGAGPGGGPHIRIFTPSAQPIGGFFAYDEQFRGGVSVAAGDLDGDGRDEIIVSSLADGRQPSTVRVYSGQGRLLTEYQPFGERDYAGSRLQAADTDADGWDEVIVGSVGATGSRTAIFNGQAELESQIVWGSGEPTYRPAGTAQPLATQLLLGALPGQTPLISLLPAGGRTAYQFPAFDPRFLGGVQAVVLE